MTTARDDIEGMLSMQEIELDTPMFTYLGQDWPCVPGGLRRGMGLGFGPPTEQLGRTLKVRKSAVAIINTADQSGEASADSDTPTADANIMPPHPGKQIIFDKLIYEVESVDEDPTGAAWIIHLISPNQ